MRIFERSKLLLSMTKILKIHNKKQLMAKKKEETTKPAAKKVAVKKVKKTVAAEKKEKTVAVKKVATKKVTVAKPKEKIAVEKKEKKVVVKKATIKKDATETLKDAVVFGMQEKKADNIVTINLKNIHNSIADYFIICQCESKTQAQAIADSIEEQVYKKTKEDPWHKEGRENSEWILLDYSNIVVHIFLREKRDFYGLEKLWGDAEIKHINGK